MVDVQKQNKKVDFARATGLPRTGVNSLRNTAAMSHLEPRCNVCRVGPTVCPKEIGDSD